MKYRYAKKLPIVAMPERTATSVTVALAVSSNTLTASFPVGGTRRGRQSATPRQSRGHAADPYDRGNSTCAVGPAERSGDSFGKRPGLRFAARPVNCRLPQWRRRKG